MLPGMAVAIEMWFAPEADVRVREVWSALEADGVTSLGAATHGRHVPHVSLTVMDTLPAQTEGLAAAAGSAVGATMRLSAVGGFPGVATFLLPAQHEALAAVQRQLHEELLAAGAPVWEYYAPGVWVPHCTMTFWANEGDIAQLAVVSAGRLPIEARVAAVKAVDTHTGEVLHHLA